MYKSYFIIALRNFLKDKTYALVNLIGLAIGLASVILIFAYVKYELSYDKSYSNSNRVYRLASENNNDEKTVMLPKPLAATLKTEFPEIEATAPLEKNSIDFLHNGEILPVRVINTNSDFFKIFNLPFLSGNPATALEAENSIVISKETAKLFFGANNPIGQDMVLKNYDGQIFSYKIMGVMHDIPANNHFKADGVIADSRDTGKLNWRFYSSAPQYILLNKNTTIDQLENKISSIYKKYDFPKNFNIQFQPVQSIHLHSNIPDEPFTNSDISYVYIFSFVALLILSIACINYVNLTTARSLKRVREVGVRKVLGAERRQLAFQFIAESLLFFLATLPVALLIAKISWPLFTKTINIEANANILFKWKNVIVVFIISIVTGVLSGLYPSVFLAKLQPVHILKDWQKSVKINLGIRKSLIVFQFVISVVLIISTIVVNKQLHFINTMQLGFNKEHLIVLPDQNMENKAAAFKNELLQNKNIKQVSIANWNVGERYMGSSSMDNPADPTKRLNFAFLSADFDFIKTMQMQIFEGRDFSAEYASDTAQIDPAKYQAAWKVSVAEWMNVASSKSIILTENTAEAIGLKKPFAGQVLKLPVLQGTVIGVVKEFQGLSLHDKSPLVVLLAANEIKSGLTYLRINPTNISATLSFIQDKWNRFFPNSTFNFSFADERIQNLYTSERRLASLFSLFAVMAILIACSGLFSLVALSVQQRTKEIGIRKVLGASITDISALLSKDFVKLVCIAILIASPIAWLLMNKWLDDFAYRIKINTSIFIFSTVLVIGITIITVLFQAIKAAMANPVKSLRTE